MTTNQPLANKLRPTDLSTYQGQEDIVGENKPLRKLLNKNLLPISIIFWGPPGSGKTTLAKILANMKGYDFVELSAVNAKKADIQAAVNKQQLTRTRTILFLDEIHRFNKAQQDALLPHVEKGTITLIGATTENPSFEVNSALLSRSQVFVLKPLTTHNLTNILKQAINNKEKGLGQNPPIISNENIQLIAKLANGDARSALNILELANNLKQTKQITKETIKTAIQTNTIRYDKNGEEHYNIISALHKSMRDSDIEASIYWCSRMIVAGEDPKYIVRRMVRFASEDIGNADTNALQLAINTKQAVEFLGYPECDTALIQLAIYLAKTKKDNRAYAASKKAKQLIKETGNLSVPLVMRNAPTALMKQLNYGKDYQYAHNNKEAAKNQQHLPDELHNKDINLYKEKEDKK